MGTTERIFIYLNLRKHLKVQFQENIHCTTFNARMAHD